MKNNPDNQKYLSLLFAVLLISVFARFYDLPRDPPPFDQYGASTLDEGFWISNARNKVLFGQWLDENNRMNPMYISPVFNILIYFSFSSLGVSTFSMRIAPALIGIISLLIFWLIISRKYNVEGSICLILLALNSMLIVYSRIALLESIILLFIIPAVGLLYYNTKYSYFVVGFLVPFIFFTKSTSLFFIVAIPLSMLIEWLLYKTSGMQERFIGLIAGGVVSLALWSLWIISNFSSWQYMTFMGAEANMDLGFLDPGKFLYSLLYFSLINAIILFLAVVWLINLVKSFKEKKILSFLDIFLFVSTLLFILQVFLTESSLRRFVLILPVLIVMAASVLTKLYASKQALKLDNHKIDGNILVLGIIIFYILFNVASLSYAYFNNFERGEGYSHTQVELSKEIGKYVPAGAKVYGAMALPLCADNRIRTYFSYSGFQLGNSEEHMLYLLKDKKEIDYAILSDYLSFNGLKTYDKSESESKVNAYIKENFELIRVLNGKYDVSNTLGRDLYLYKRITPKNSTIK
jgi:4-amino-4-deoxy-L-arabinose transferase-like glycosyltransferase